MTKTNDKKMTSNYETSKPLIIQNLRLPDRH